jgi:hypothetical protein
LFHHRHPGAPIARDHFQKNSPFSLLKEKEKKKKKKKKDFSFPPFPPNAKPTSFPRNSQETS